MRIGNKTVLTSVDLLSAAPSKSSKGWALAVVLKPGAQTRLASETKANIGKKMDVWVNDEKVSSSIIKDELKSSHMSIGGPFSEAQAKTVQKAVR